MVNCHPVQEEFGGSKSLWDMQSSGEVHQGRCPLFGGSGQGPSHDLKTLFIYGGGGHAGRHGAPGVLLAFAGRCRPKTSLLQAGFRLLSAMHCCVSYLKLPAVNYPLRQLWITLKQSALCLSPRKSASESGRVIHSHWKSTLAFSRNTSQVPLVTRQAQGWALPGIGEAHWWGCLLDPKNFGRRKRSPLAASWSRV